MSAIDSDLFSLRWNNFHSNMITEFHALLQEEDLVDVTLAAGGRFTQAHKIVLSVCSPYFKELFKLNPCKHPIVILKDVGHKELLAILQFMYRGEVNVSQEDLTSFLKTAELLQIKGLTGDESGKIRQNNSVHSPVPRSNPVQSPVSRSIHRGETSSVNSNSKPQNLTKPRLPNLALIDDYVRSPPPQKRSRSSDTTPTHSNNRIYARIPSSDSIEDSKVITPEFFRVKDEPVDECDEEDGEIEQESVLLSENGKSRTKVKVDLHNSSSQPEASHEQPMRTLPGRSRLHRLVKYDERNSKGGTKRKKCRVCYRAGRLKQSTFTCAGCPDKPGLCPVDCFDTFHKNL